jgi:hypothetical protein
MTDEDIKDHVRQSTDSAIQALTAVVKSVQDDNRRHREEELASREIYREKMLKTVEDIVKVTVNGKIDKIAIKQQEDSEKIDELVADIKRSEPVIKQYEDTKSFWTVFNSKVIQIGIVGSFIGGTIYLFRTLAKLSQ